MTAAELAELDPVADAGATSLTWRQLGRIAASRDVLLLSFSYLCMNYTFYLLTYWSFLYLVQVRHFASLESGLMGMLPWIGGAAAGFSSDRLVARRGSRWGYRIVPLMALRAVAALPLVTIQVSHPYAAVPRSLRQAPGMLGFRPAPSLHS